MQLTTENTKEFIEFWNNNKPEKFVHPMHEGIATVILDYLDQAEYQLTLEDNKVTVFDQQTNEELGEYTPEELFWKARLLIESNDKDSRSSTNHYNNLLDIFSNKELSPKEYNEQIRDELQNYYLTNECFNKNDELKWNSIDYTTKNWIEIENTYYEYEETRGFLSIGDSLTDLEKEYGENNFPEKAVEDGRLLIDEQSKLEEYIIKRHALKCFSDVEELLWDYEYPTKDVLKYYIPKIDNEQLEVLTDIVDSQNINLELLRKVSFEDIYNEIDKSKLNEVQLEELNKIKEELSKPTVEIFKQSFDSFIMSLSEAASKSIQRDIEKLNAKAFYVFNVDNNEYTIVSKRKRDGENPFMIHKYYPENETGGIHHGSYDIDTYENAEKIAANRLINEQKEKYELINFIAGTREDEFNLELKNNLSSVFDYLNEYSLNEEDQIELIDVKAYQYEGPSGKLKVLVEYKGNCREDDLFNLLHYEEENGQDGHDYEINGYKIDLNPIKAEKSGTISEYLAMLKNVEEKWPEVNKLINEQKENVMYKKIYSKDSNGYETWTDYDNKGNVIYYKDSNGFERSSTVEYVSKEQYLQEKNNSQIETKYTKADINDLQSFFFPYPQLSESLCYQILDDFELYKIPLFKDSDGNIYQREMNTDLAEGDESDYQLLTQDGIIDHEYNWLIDRKYTPEDEIDLQKELEDIKKFEENPKSYYKKIFKLALEKEIEKVKKEINEGNVKDVIEKNILEIAEERLGSYASPEEIIGWYISDDEKNYFENWKNSGDFPDYKEALDSMFAYVYEHDTSKQNLRYISDLNDTTQNKLKTLLQEHFEKEGLSEGEIKTAIQNAIDSKIDDLNQLMESNEKIKSLLTNEEDWQQVVYEWNERKQGTNSEFKPIGTLVEVNPSHKQQCESLRKNTSFIDIYDAELILGMINYDKDSFEFMLDIDNGNFVEIDRKNNKIIDVTDTEGALSYLRDEINYRTQDVVEESFTVEEIAAANRLIRPLEFIDNKNRQKIIEKNIYVVEEGLVTGSREPSFVPYNEFASKRLLDKTFTTKEACEVFCRKENAFQIAKAHIDEVDNSKEYSEAEKEKYVKVYFEQSEKNWDEYDNQVPSYKELEILIKGLDAFNHGEEALTFTRPDADDIENGFDNGWDFSEICKGYAEFADGYNESNVICRLDDMMIFDSDSDAALQAKKDGYQFLEVGKDIIFPEEMLNDDIEYRNYIDTPENRTILKDFLRLKEHSISVDYAFPDDLTYKKEDGNEIKITIYEEPRWDFEDNNELLNIIKEADEDYYDEIKKIITENPSRKFNFDLGKSLRYDDNTFYNSFHIDYSKETLSQKLDNKFIVRYWTTDDTFENKLPQISNFDFAGEDSTIIILNNEVTEKLNAMIRKHVKNNIDAFENYKTYRNEQISKVLYAEIKQHGEPIITINEDGETNARFQTFTISNDLHDLLELPHVSWHDAQTGKSYPYQYALYADFNLDGNSIDETKEPEIKYFEFIDDGTKEIQSADSMKRNLGLLEQNQSIKEVITNTFKQVAQEYYNQNVSFELPVKQQNETTMQFTTENTKKTQMYKIIYKQSSQGIKEWHEYDPNGNEIHYKDSNGVEEWREYDSNGNKIHYKDSEGFEVWYEYDSNGNKICSKDSDNLETQHENDSNGNEIYSKRSDDYEQWYEYDSNGNKIHYKDSNGFEQWYEYNSNGKEIHYKDSHSFEYWKEYDSKGNVIHYKDATGFERWLKYDSNGNHIYSKDSNGSEKWSTVEYLTKEQYLLEKNEAVQKFNKAESLTFGQFNSDTNEIKLIKEAYFKELVIDENNASKNKVILGFKENDQEHLLEMGENEYKNLLNAFGFLKEQQENTLEINKFKTFAEEKPEVVFELIKSDYLGGTPFSDNELIGYLKGLKKSNNYHHYLDELLFESLEQSDESLFSNVVDVGADLTWRREENGEPINILHYAAADNLDIAIRKIIEKTKSLEVDDYINLFSEENFEGHTPLEIVISNSDGQYFESTKLLIDAMDDKGFSGVKDLLFEDKLGNKVLYTSKDNLDCVSILCFDKNNNIISSDTESLVDEKSLGEIISQDLIYQTNNDFIKGNIELNRSSKLISELKEVPQKLWNDEINIKLLKTLPEAGFFNSKKDLYDFDSILALEKIKKSLFSDFDNQKESLLQGLYTKKEFVDSIKEKELNLEELNNCEIGEFVECLENKYFRTELAALCFDKKINELFDTISPRPNEMGMYKNNDYTCLSLKISAASNNRPITEGEAEIILKYIQYENFNFYESMNNELCMLDVSEDFTGGVIKK